MDVDAQLYLPIDEATLDEVLDDGRSVALAVGELSAHEMAALLTLAQLATPPVTRRARSPARVLATAIATCSAAVAEVGIGPLREQVQGVLRRADIARGRQRLPELGITLLDGATVTDAGFLTPDGQWDHTFAARHSAHLERSLVRFERTSGTPLRLTLEQSRIYREVESQRDEHVHVQGFAGTGKSLLIRSLIAMIQAGGGRILVLAERARQLEGIQLDGGEERHIDKRTFAALARDIVPRGADSAAYRNLYHAHGSRDAISDAALANLLGIRANGPTDERQIARAVRETLYVFCRGDADALSENHLPRHYGRRFDVVTKAIIHRHAAELWRTLVSQPAGELARVVRDHHRIKWAALNRWPVPARYTHVVIDESHDLPGAVRQILAGSSQALATLGDEHQNLAGYGSPPPVIARQREMTHSVRAGQAVEVLVNPIIAARTGGSGTPFHGNRMKPVEILHYDPARAAVPDEPAAILVNDTWGLVEWVQRVASGNADVRLLGYRPALDRFVADCIALRAHGTRPRHVELVRFGSWHEVAEHHRANPGFRRVERLLERGYTDADWWRTGARLSARSSASYSVGLIKDVLNLEFDTVMLTPGVVGDARSRGRAAFGASVYVAVTRAQRRLIVPETLRQWLEEISTGAFSTPAAR